MAKKLSKRVRKQIINIAVLLILIGVTFIVIFTSQDIDFDDIWSFVRGCNKWYIAAAFGCQILYILLEAFALHVIVRRLGDKPKFTASIAYSTSDMYYSSITPSASGGQPATAFYMMRDGISGGSAGFSVLFNTIAYTVGTIIIGLIAVFAYPTMFGQVGHWFAKALIIFGFVVLLLLLALLLLCLFKSSIILKIGGWGISLLAKMHILKKPDKWREKLKNMVIKYRACRGVIKEHPILFLYVLLLNTAQRASQTLIPCFVIMAAMPVGGKEFFTLFCMQAYVLIGYNTIPLPGGTGAYEYLYPNVFGNGAAFGIALDMTFVLSAMMVSRVISYYFKMIVCGIYTLIYHIVGMKKGVKVDEEIDLDQVVKQSIIDGSVAGAALDDDDSGQDNTDTDDSCDKANDKDGNSGQETIDTDDIQPDEQSAQNQNDAESKDANDD